MSLSSLTVQREVATMRQVEEALARQVIYGGDFVTNLLEVARLDEGVLVSLVGESLGIAPAPAGELPPAPEGARALVPPELAAQHSVVPLALEGNTLVLAVADTLPPDVAEHLAFALGLSIDQRAAPLVRVRQAMARAYGVPLERRMDRLLTRLAGGVPASGSMPPPLGAAPPVAVAPSPPLRATTRGMPAAQVPATASVPPPSRPRAPTADSEPPSQHLLGERRAGLLQREVAATARASRRRRGPVTLEVATADAEDATDRDALLDLFFDFARQFFDYTAIFVVHGDIAEGRDAFGTGAGREGVVGIGVPLDLPGLMSQARDRRASVVAKPPADGLDAQLLADLQRPRDVELAIVPLVVRTRAVALLVGDCGEVGVERSAVQQIVRFASVIGKAFERIIVRRKLEGFVAGSKGASSGKIDASLVPPKKSVPPVVAAPEPSPRPPPLAIPFGTPTPPSATAFAPEVRTAPGPPPVFERTASPSPAPAVRTARPSTPPMPTASAPPPPPVNIAALRAISGPPIPREEPESPARVPVEDVAPASSPSVHVTMTEVEATSGLFDELGWDAGLDDEGAPGVPPSSAIVVPAHAPAIRHAPNEALPSVIVNMDEDLEALVRRVIEGDADGAAEGELLRTGERAMRVIMRHFPGPTSYARSRIAAVASPPRASECGPVLRLVARQRKVALPFVLERLGDADPEVRGWATHLLVELPYVDALPHALVRLKDIDVATRASAALAVSAIGRAFPDEARGMIEALAQAPEPHDRAAAMRALAELREPELVPELVRGLADGDDVVVQAAVAGLVTLTRQDLGSDARRWLKWWEVNAQRHRIEWLIDALTHDVGEIRRGAGDELKALTKEYFGYAADLPARDRERAQQRYRDWWITEGKARFRRKA